MACGTVFGCGLVEQNRFLIHRPHEFVTRFTAHVAMCTLQREGRSRVVIERRRFPLEAVVTVRARRVLAFRKLPPVRILVTPFTGRGRCFEICVNQLGAHILWLVAIDTGCGAVRPEQRERSLGVVEARQFLPGLGRVTSFATPRPAVSSQAQHAFLELIFVRVRMATGAGEILPAIDCGRLWRELRGLFMAVSARNREVSVGEHKVGFFMTGQGERRRLVAVKIVATLAGVEIRRSRELPGMLIAVAVGAAFEFDFE